VVSLGKDYDILTTRLESYYLTSPDFTLQTAFLHLHPTLHVLSLLYSLCQALEDQQQVESDEDSSEDEDMAQYLRNADGESKNKGIIGGEVLGVVVERASCMNG
jgi:gamma-tubulin complex component 2